MESFREGKVPYLHCLNCKRNFFYPRDRCPNCHSSSLEVRVSSGKGKVFSVTEFQGKVYAIIEMEEGFRLYANVLDKVEIGEEVIAVKGDGRPNFKRVSKP
ncbi:MULTISPECIES: Zn-ribbon domain-containing OB-fold protein [Metallosphaera]|uniref:ChsH2 rubredoxin-like zinc ribbon domain-containing protein n=1 Tax=Metallosphaera cuprina (strain Ar-4) TaxID=1006006 RepID=F4G386_METCR|nr:zinc ribbon domain-containing protein [Metallosphaera cuprina]AEB95284.1 conserved hypothetical protein [Metallosphaera cuprina Ar-4]